MNVAFIVTLDLDDVSPESLATTASDIMDDLASSHIVITVQPWQRPSLNPGGAPPPSPTSL